MLKGLEQDLDGFRCELPGEKFGSNSAWILVFVASWWLVAVSLVVLGSRLFPMLYGSDYQVLQGIFGVIGVGGWAPGWYVFDAWWAWRHPRILEADALGIRLDGKRWLFSEMNRFGASHSISFAHSDGFESIRLGVGTQDREWLQENLMALFNNVAERDGGVPQGLNQLRDQNEE